MGQLLVYGLLAIVLAAVLFVLAARFLPAGEQIAPPLRDEPPWELPADRELRADDIDTVRLPVSLRGYRFGETDILLDRLAGELRSRDLEIARLRGLREPAAAGLAPMSFARPDAAGDRLGTPTGEPSETPVEEPSEAPVEESSEAPVEPASGSWEPAVPAGAPEGDAPQPPPFADEEQPVTDTPATPDDDRR